MSEDCRRLKLEPEKDNLELEFQTYTFLWIGWCFKILLSSWSLQAMDVSPSVHVSVGWIPSTCSAPKEELTASASTALSEMQLGCSLVALAASVTVGLQWQGFEALGLENYFLLRIHVLVTGQSAPWVLTSSFGLSHLIIYLEGQISFI